MAKPFLIYSLNHYFFDSSRKLSFSIILPATPILLSWQAWHNIGLDCFHFARRYFGNHCCFLFLKVLRCFTSLRCLLSIYIFNWRYLDINLDGLSHSEISGSKICCISPKLIAATHVLHRLYMPRHPPYTHSNLTYTFLISLNSTDRQYYFLILWSYI